MKRIGWPLVLILVLGGAPRALWPQATTPEAALEELVTAEKIEDAAKHLPPEAEQIMESLSPEHKREFAQRIFPREWLKTRQLTLHKNDDGEWSLIWRDRKEFERISIINSVVSGTDAFVRLRCKIGGVCRAREVLVSMILQDNEWRVTSFGNWQPKLLESKEFLRRLTPMGKNEAAALEAIEEISGALYDYAREHHDIGFPADLQALSTPSPHNDEHKNLSTVDAWLLAGPVIKDGYEFHYTRLYADARESQEGWFRITAIPLQFGKTGERSFFADETGAIRFTMDNRAASANDEELDQSAMIESQGSPITISPVCQQDFR